MLPKQNVKLGALCKLTYVLYHPSLGGIITNFNRHRHRRHHHFYLDVLLFLDQQ